MTETDPLSRGPLELLVLQPTPFCNLNCSYCYLPNRQSTKRMSPEVLDQTFRWVFASGLVKDEFAILWHAGEPMVLPTSFYALALELLARHNRQGTTVHQTMQTNATLIDAPWCEFIRQHHFHIGVSVDGPAFLHDSRRRTRQGAGTLERVLHGIHLLLEHDIPFYVISVLTADSLDYPDELFDFYQEHGITNLAFNVEEIEGPNKTSSLAGAEMKERFRRFLSRFLDLMHGADPPMSLREFDTAASALRSCRFGPGARTQENQPWAIVSVDCEGNFSTFSPELLGLTSERHGSFAFGNVARDSLETVHAADRFRQIAGEIGHGVERCQRTCPYFPYCGGGPPETSTSRTARSIRPRRFFAGCTSRFAWT